MAKYFVEIGLERYTTKAEITLAVFIQSKSIASPFEWTNYSLDTLDGRIHINTEFVRYVHYVMEESHE